MDAAGEIRKDPANKHQVQPEYGDAQVDAGRAGITQEEGHTRFLHIPSVVLALFFLARNIQSFLSLIDREVDI